MSDPTATSSATGPGWVDDVFAAVVARPEHAMVALDYDGTLAPIVTRPEDAVPAPGGIDAVRRLTARVGTVAFVTGRPLSELLSLSGLDIAWNGGRAPESLVLRGHYGLERWDSSSGRVIHPPAAAGVEEARAVLRRLIELCPRGVRIEDKRLSLAVHTREADDPWTALKALLPVLAELAEETALELALGRFVIELRPRGVDKGATLRELIRDRRPESLVFIGDDVGDEPAFEVVDQARAEGVLAVAVLSDSDEAAPRMRARAHRVVPGPEGVVRLLNDLADRME
jgi:trehalose 6-phosphate phosphatase